MNSVSMPNHGSKVICITGANGFLGSATARALANDGYKVIALSRKGFISNSLNNNTDILQVSGTVEDWVTVIANEKPISVLSFDWSGVGREHRDDQIQQESNIARIIRLAEAAKSVGAQSFLALGSQAEVAPQVHPIAEFETDAPQSVYGEAKVTARKEVQSILSGSETKFIWGRVFTIYGPGDTRDSFITRIIKSLLVDENFHVANPNGSWSFLYIGDFVNALETLIGHQEVAGIINIGNPVGTKIADVAEQIAESLGKLGRIGKPFAMDSDSNDLTWIPETPSLSNLGWKAKVQMDSGLEATIKWWKGELK